MDKCLRQQFLKSPNLSKFMNKLKISFLIPANNEEKVIGNALDNLSKMPYDNLEVLIGLDRCIDNTKYIVDSYKSKIKSLKSFELESKNGKPQVIDYLMEYVDGDIIIIHDADWQFKVTSKESFLKYLSVFNDYEIGGIAESFPVEYDIKSSKSNFWFRVVSLSHFFWMKYQKDYLTSFKKGYKTLNDPTMFLTNIFRKSLYQKNYSLADDFERSKNIMDQGYSIAIFDDLKMPRFVSTYHKINLRDLFKQKRRTSIARKQLKKIHEIDLPLLKYTFPVLFYMLKESFKESIFSGIKVGLWILINIIAKLSTIFSSLSSKKGWNMRASR